MPKKKHNPDSFLPFQGQFVAVRAGTATQPDRTVEAKVVFVSGETFWDTMRLRFPSRPEFHCHTDRGTRDLYVGAFRSVWVG